MTRGTPAAYPGFRGLNTSAAEVGLPHDRAVQLEGWRIISGDLVPQPGMVRLGKATGAYRAGEFVAASSHYFAVKNPATAWTLKRHWTLRVIIEPDSVTGTQNILAFNHATAWPVKLYLDGTTLTAKVTDTADTVVTLTGSTTFAVDTVYGIELVRNGTALTLYVNGSEDDSDTMADLDCKVPSSDLYFGRDNSGSYFDGTIEGPELLVVSDLPTTRSLVRFQDPKGPVCRAAYNLDLSADNIAKDLSRFGNHAIGQGGVTDVASIAHASAQCHGVATFTGTNGKARIVLGMGGNLYVTEPA